MRSADILAIIGGVSSILLGDPRVGVCAGVTCGDGVWGIRPITLVESKNDIEYGDWAGLGWTGLVSGVNLWVGVIPLLKGRKKGKSGCLEVPSCGHSKVL